MNSFGASELITNPDGSIYHLKLKPHQLAKTILLVGDPGRVEMVSAFFKKTEHKTSNREFVCHTGIYNSKRLSVISSGIGPDNMDIVINELDALVNIDLKNSCKKPQQESLTFVRIGTTGSIQESPDIDEFVVSEYGMGLDGVLYFYERCEEIIQQDMSCDVADYLKDSALPNKPYIVAANQALLQQFSTVKQKGITLTAPGFYGPQGRSLNAKSRFEKLINKLAAYNYTGHKITNIEMETSVLYGLSGLLGHKALTVCAVMANRKNNTFSTNYKKTINNLIQMVLDII